MTSSDEDLHTLWRAVFGEPPPVHGDAPLMCELLVRYLPAAPPYAPVPLASPRAVKRD